MSDGVEGSLHREVDKIRECGGCQMFIMSIRAKVLQGWRKSGASGAIAPQILGIWHYQAL